MSVLGWLRKNLSRPPKAPQPRPANWTKTLSDLAAENRNLSGQEIEWAREYEREQLRSWARFPKDAEEFEACHDVTISYVIHWRAPYSTGGEGTLPKGTRIRVMVHSGDPSPVGVHAMPVDDKAFEERLVPESDRLGWKYDGYSLFIGVAQLNREFQLVVRDPGCGRGACAT